MVSSNVHLSCHGAVRCTGTAGEPRPGRKQDSLQLIRHKSTTSESFKPKLKFWLAGLLAAAPSVSTLLGHCFNFLLNLLYTLQNSIGRGTGAFVFQNIDFVFVFDINIPTYLDKCGWVCGVGVLITNICQCLCNG